MTISFRCDSARLQDAFDFAAATLGANVKLLHDYPEPVLTEGAVYDGAWLECAPHEGLAFAGFNARVALASHRVFIHHQRQDGYLPCYVWKDRGGESQIQTVVPIARTALELGAVLEDRDFLEEAYAACTRWQGFLTRYRDPRGLGLLECFCEYDTGHDNSPRFSGLPKTCERDDARYCPTSPELPLLAPDLSATFFGERLALAQMATQLGRENEAREWHARADLPS